MFHSLDAEMIPKLIVHVSLHYPVEVLEVSEESFERLRPISRGKGHRLDPGTTVGHMVFLMSGVSPEGRPRDIPRTI